MLVYALMLAILWGPSCSDSKESAGIKHVVDSIFNCIPSPFNQFMDLSLFSYLNRDLELNYSQFGNQLVGMLSVMLVVKFWNICLHLRS